MKLENLEGLLQIDCASDMLETWSPWDFRTFLESRPSEFDQLQINLILLLFVDSGLSVFTARTKEIMEILLQDGADPMFKFPVGTNLICINEAPTIASEALKKPDVDIVTMFLDHLEDIDAPLDIYARRPIHIITQFQDESFLPIVLDYDPDLDIQDDCGLTAFHLAVLENNYPKTSILECAGVDVDIVDNSGNAPIHYFITYPQGDPSLASLLLDVANVTLSNLRGDTPLHRLMKTRKPHVLRTLKSLLDKGADPWKPNYRGCTPLNHIVKLHRKFPPSYTFEILKTIFESGTPINRRDPLGNPILHIIAMWDCPLEILNLLLEYGADPNLVDQRNKTVIDIYKDANHSQGIYLIKYLVLKSFENKFQFGPQLLSSIESYNKFAECFRVYKEELSYFECSSFHSTKPFTLLDVLTATSIQVLVRYVKNKDLRRTMATFDVDNHTAYGNDLKRNFELGFERYETEMKAIQNLSSGGFMNFDCMEAIVKFLPIEELRRIVNIS